MNLDPNRFIYNNFPIYVYYSYNLIIEEPIRQNIFENCSNYYYTKSEKSLINIADNIKQIIDDNMMEESYILNKKKYYNILNIFDHILIINLKHRTDRRNQIQEQIQRLNIEKNKYEIIEAIYDENGVIGCAKSHIRCLEYAKSKNYNNVLITTPNNAYYEGKLTLSSSKGI